MDYTPHNIYYDSDHHLNVAKFLKDGHLLSSARWTYLYNNVPVSDHGIRFYAHFIKVKLKQEGISDLIADRIKSSIVDLAKKQKIVTASDLEKYALSSTELFWSATEYKGVLTSARVMELEFILKYVKKYTNINLLIIFFTITCPSIIMGNYDTTLTTFFIIGFLFISKLLYVDKINKEAHEYKRRL
jgi:hypothetical protein